MQSGMLSLSLMREPMISSDTRPPESSIFETSLPNLLPDATASLSMSPVLIFGMLHKSHIKSA